MSRLRACVAAAAAVAVLAGTWLVVDRPDEPLAQPAAPVTQTLAPAPSPTPARTPARPTSTRAPTVGAPPRGTARIDEAYLSRYHARRVDWDGILAHGRPFPGPSAGCTSRWEQSGKSDELSWRRARYWCLDSLVGGHWTPQGVAGSGTTTGYRIGGRAAGSRNIVLTSWYSRAAEKHLVAPNKPGQSVTRLMVLDLDRHRYARVELVRPDGSSGLRNLNSHGSGLAWAGQYLYSSSRSWLWMYNADDLLEIHGHYVLPAVARWSVGGSGGASSISIDRSSRDRLLAVNYTRNGPSYVHTFALTGSGRLATPARAASPALELTTGFGEKHRVVRSLAALTLPGTHYQGVGRWSGITLANSSSMPTGRANRRHDAVVVLQHGRELRRFRLPEGNVESVYVDDHRRTYTSLTEGGARFLFVLPLHDVVSRAR